MKDNILKKVEALPPDKQEEVMDFVSYLYNKYLPDFKEKESFSSLRRHNLGRLKGKIWMAGDFDQTPDDFKEYL